MNSLKLLMIPFVLPLIWKYKWIETPEQKKEKKLQKKKKQELKEMRKYNKLVQEKI